MLYVLLGLTIWLACGYVGAGLLSGNWERQFGRNDQGAYGLFFWAMGVLGPVVLTVGVIVSIVEWRYLGFNARWPLGRKKDHPYCYPDTWLRGMRWQLVTQIALFIAMVGNGMAHLWTGFMIDLGCSLACIPMNLLTWTKRGDMIAAEKARKVVPAIFGGPVGGPGGGPGFNVSNAATALYNPMTQTPGVVVGDRPMRHPDYPNTFGWRAWRWDSAAKLLRSPAQQTLWHHAELRVPEWDEQHVVRGVAGIHAEYVSLDWETRISEYAMHGTQTVTLTLPPGAYPGAQYAVRHGTATIVLNWDDRGYWHEPQSGNYFPAGYQFSVVDTTIDNTMITGIVERFGKYVMGTEGWRAEWVMIRKLLAPNNKIGLELEKAYPDVEVIYPKGNDDGHR